MDTGAGHSAVQGHSVYVREDVTSSSTGFRPLSPPPPPPPIIMKPRILCMRADVYEREPSNVTVRLPSRTAMTRRMSM